MTFLDKSYFSVHIIGMELNFNCLPSDMIHVSAFDGQNDGVMELMLWLTCLDILVDMLMVLL
jgi:hypothetical protein